MTTRQEIFQIEDKAEAYKAIDALYTNPNTRGGMRQKYNFFRKHGFHYGTTPKTTTQTATTQTTQTDTQTDTQTECGKCGGDPEGYDLNCGHPLCHSCFLEDFEDAEMNDKGYSMVYCRECKTHLPYRDDMY
jgi:hypothetical protein